MSDLIDRDVARNFLRKRSRVVEFEGIISHCVPYNEIDRVPNVDAVEVVRCKDCIRYTDEAPGAVYCPNIRCWVTDEFYCADGERK